MLDSGFKKRLSDSAADFVLGVQPVLERRLNATIYPVEDLQHIELARRLDLSGIDAFYYDKSGDPRALGSRMNYHSSAAPVGLLLPFAMRCGTSTRRNGTATASSLEKPRRFLMRTI